MGYNPGLMNGSPGTSRAARAAGGLVLLVTLASAGFFGYVALERMLARPVAIAAALGVLACGGGLAVVLMGLAAALRPRPDPSSAIASSLNDVRARLDEIAERIGTVSALAQQTITSATAPVHSALDEETISRMQSMLEEIRELSLLSDEDRRARLSKVIDERRRQIAREVMEHVAKQEWAKAEQMLATLEAHFPNDPHTIGCRRDLHEARFRSATTTVAQTRQRVEGLMSTGSWEQAITLATTLCENFPTNSDARELLSRVTREHQIFIDITAQRLFEDIRRDVERREWRRALEQARKMLSQFPLHARAARIREQIPTIQDNAEILERQEIEVQIQELVRARRIGDAIELSEDLIRRYPVSPQAQRLTELLPRLREMLGEVPV